MSDLYYQKFGNRKVSKAELRLFHSRPGRKDENGDPIYTTEQHHKKECDINEIIKKYDAQGIITHVSRFEGRFGDMTGMDFKAMQDKVAAARSSFSALPAEIRKEFGNDPAQLLTFMEDANNRDRAIELGLINPAWTEETDGLGEHVPEGGNVNKTEENISE